jgi:Metallo-peptidase family M12/Secretion system C-terminal sorting domain
MKFSFLRRSGLLVASFFALNAGATSTSRVASYVRHIQENTPFVAVSDIWQPDNNFDQTLLLTKVKQAQPLTIDYTQVANFMQQKNNGIKLVVPGLGGATYTIDLARYDFFSNSFAVFTRGADNKDMPVAYTPGVYYRGVIEGIDGSVAAFSFFNDEVYGVFSIPGVGNMVLVPNTMTGKYYNYNQHYILYNDRDLLIKDKSPGCASDKLPETDLKNASQRTTTTENDKVYDNCTEVRVLDVADYQMYSSKGSSSTNVTNYLTSLFNNEATLYDNEGIGIVLQNVVINTTSDVYQTLPDASPNWLTKFGFEIQNTYRTTYGCDLAMLFTTKYGDMGGIAWLQSMCANYVSSDTFGAYAFCNIDNSAVVNFPTFSWDVLVSTHEMGHVLGSPHTHRCCWNPPGTGTTAIDGCYADAGGSLEGSCAMPVPSEPVGGGTIMSYCHLTSDGINFAYGFGQQPGDTVRYFLAHKFSTTCGVHYTPSAALILANKTISATRQCTDIASGDTTTYYWNDNQTASHADDTLLLMVRTHGNNIGTLDSSGFSVKTTTLVRRGSGKADTATFPGGLGIHSKNYTMRRYWQIAGATTATTPVDVYFPFILTDTSDVDGSVPGYAPLSGYYMYKVASTIDPNPANNFSGSTVSSFQLFTYATTASTTKWSLTTTGTTYFADMQMTNLNGGGTGFYTYGPYPASVQEINTANTDVVIFPNPTNDSWNVSVSKNVSGNLSLELYGADGKLIRLQPIQNGATTNIDATQLPAGVYFYHITGGSTPYVGSVIKK